MQARLGIVKYGKLNPEIVGQPVTRLAEIFGIKNVPPGARVIVGEVENIGHTEAFAHEKMSPILGAGGWWVVGGGGGRAKGY